MAVLTLRKRVLAVSMSALLVFAFTGCEDDKPSAEDSSSPADEASSADPTDDVTSAEPTGGESVAPADFVDLLQQGLNSATTAHVTLDAAVQDGGFTAEGDIDLGSVPPAMFMTMKNPALGGDITFILVKKVAYVQLPQLNGKFLQFKFDDPNNPLGADFIDSFDPRTSVAELEASIQSVNSVGDEDVDGETLAHYEVVVDASTFEVSDSEAGTHDLDLWLDEENRISRFVFDSGEQGSVTASYTDWGRDVVIEAPAPDDIVSLPGG